MSELLPCPFCGGKPSTDSNGALVSCCCLVTRWMPVADWNRRAAPKEEVAQVPVTTHFTASNPPLRYASGSHNAEQIRGSDLYKLGDVVQVWMLERDLYASPGIPADVVRDAERYRAINTPEIHDFIVAVEREALHQRERWASEHDAGKTDADWFWLIGYLAGKALNKPEKQLHHIITTAAACLNWHAATLKVRTAMRPGIEPPDAALRAAGGGPSLGVGGAESQSAPEVRASLSAAVPSFAAPEPRNQCDGCARGLPINASGNHYEPGGMPVMGCAANRYAPPGTETKTGGKR